MADNVLMGFGIFLSAVGIVLFARTKVTGDNWMQMLGLQVKVSHPSLLIFFAGVVLVLVPRLLPQGGEPPAAEAEAPGVELDPAAEDATALAPDQPLAVETPAAEGEAPQAGDAPAEAAPEAQPAQ